MYDPALSRNGSSPNDKTYELNVKCTNCAAAIKNMAIPCGFVVNAIGTKCPNCGCGGTLWRDG